MAKYLESILDTIFDSRDLFERMTEIESEFTDEESGDMKITDPEVSEEYETIKAVSEEIGDEFEWGTTLIREDYFEDFAQQYAEEIGAVPGNIEWPNAHIDWESAARELQMDYSSVEIEGDTYWYR